MEQVVGGGVTIVVKCSISETLETNHRDTMSRASLRKPRALQRGFDSSRYGVDSQPVRATWNGHMCFVCVCACACASACGVCVVCVCVCVWLMCVCVCVCVCVFVCV